MGLAAQIRAAEQARQFASLSSTQGAHATAGAQPAAATTSTAASASNSGSYQTAPTSAPPVSFCGTPTPATAGVAAPGNSLKWLSAINAKFTQICRDNNLGKYYTPADVARIAHETAARIDIEELAKRWGMGVELAIDLTPLALYDTKVLVDDSGSMDDRTRWEDAQAILKKIADVCGKLDSDGFDVCFMNSSKKADNIKSDAQIATLMTSQVKPSGGTPMGSQLLDKLVQPYLDSLHSMLPGKKPKKPLLVITITDGAPNSEPDVYNAIARASEKLVKYGYPEKGIAFQFAQIDNDPSASDFLNRLDNDPKIGNKVDCTSDYEVEALQIWNKQKVRLTPGPYLVKLCVGAIDRTYDEQDE